MRLVVADEITQGWGGWKRQSGRKNNAPFPYLVRKLCWKKNVKKKLSNRLARDRVQRKNNNHAPSGGQRKSKQEYTALRQVEAGGNRDQGYKNNALSPYLVRSGPGKNCRKEIK